MPRIIAGTRRGLRLDVPAGEKTRPTADRTKEALFSILQPWLAGASVLDLYAGSGQIGLEALSRGAARAVFVESNRHALGVLDNNLKKAALAGCEVIRLPAARALAGLVSAGDRFDLIYIDPPWLRFAAELASLDPFLHRLLNGGGRLVTERQVEPKTPETTLSVTGLEHIRHCRYGRAMLSFFAVKGEV